MVVHLRDHHLMTTSALDAIVDIIATALDWCRRDVFINFATRTNDTDAASLQPLSFVDSVMSALEFIDHNVQRSIKSEYMLCNAFLADDTNVWLVEYMLFLMFIDICENIGFITFECKSKKIA